MFEYLYYRFLSLFEGCPDSASGAEDYLQNCQLTGMPEGNGFVVQTVSTSDKAGIVAEVIVAGPKLPEVGTQCELYGGTYKVNSCERENASYTREKFFTKVRRIFSGGARFVPEVSFQVISLELEPVTCS